VKPDISKYLTQQVMTASPAKLVSMLYDKVVISLKEAIAAIEAGEIETRWRANARATEILSHMWATLDVDKGGEIARNLDQLFSYMLSRLPEVDLRNDPAPAREVIELIGPLRDSWRELAKQETVGNRPNAPSARPDSAGDMSKPTSSTSFSA
jgi:flagellar protein FliS